MVVREDSLTLYGFADDDERAVFELLQTASGIGPRLAQAMLAVHAPDALRTAVADRRLAALTQVPGHRQEGCAAASCWSSRSGSARRPALCRVGAHAWAARVGLVARCSCWTALLGLGWSAREADDAVGGGRRPSDGRRVAAWRQRRT